MVNAEFFDALEQLEKEKGIPVDYMLDRVGQALITAYKRDNDGMTDNVYVEPDRDKKTIHMFVRKTVVKAEDLYSRTRRSSRGGCRVQNNPMVGDIIDIDIPTKSFGRIAAQTAKQVIIQGIREAERHGYLRVREQGARDPERRGCPHRSLRHRLSGCCFRR
ncbi:MAG: NusA N-terminal domain-containing protein [Butyricicoccus sp.]